MTVFQPLCRTPQPWSIGAKLSAKEFAAQWLSFAAGISPDRVGRGKGPLTWLRSTRHALLRRNVHICLLTCGSDRVKMAPLTAWTINQRSKLCSASVDEGLEKADIVWICAQDPIALHERDRISELIRTKARSDANVINRLSTYNGYHGIATFRLLAAHGVSVPRSTFTDADVGVTRVIYKQTGCQGGRKRNVPYQGGLPGMAAFEFIDSANSEGLHRRFRAHYFLGLVRPSEVFLSDHWNVCLRNAQQVQYGFDLSPEEERQIRRIAQLLELDFFAVDFVRRGSDDGAFFTDINVYPTIRSPQQLVHRRGDFGEWHTFDACWRLGVPEPLGGNLWDHFDRAILRFTQAPATETAFATVSEAYANMVA